MDSAETSHPYYWSGFAVVGDGAVPVIRTNGAQAAGGPLNLLGPASFRLRHQVSNGRAGALNEKSILLAVFVGGVLAMPHSAQAQPQASSPPDQPDGQESKPIVPDSEFEEALPSLDPELNQPLEPLENLENAPPFPPVPGPVEDAPLGDPALAEPLPPLSTADVEPVDTGPVTGDEAAEPVPIHYQIIVEGLEETGLEGRFRNLSALEDARGEAVNGAMIAARAEEDESLIVRMLRSEGYYDAVAASSIEQLPDRPGALRVTLTASPGPRLQLR
jgi:translocation and assembly module TamA